MCGVSISADITCGRCDEIAREFMQFRPQLEEAVKSARCATLCEKIKLWNATQSIEAKALHSVDRKISRENYAYPTAVKFLLAILRDRLTVCGMTLEDFDKHGDWVIPQCHAEGRNRVMSVECGWEFPKQGKPNTRKEIVGIMQKAIGRFA